MGHLLDLPPELLGFIVGHLHDDKAALRSFSLVSRASLQPSQAQLFKDIKMQFGRIHRYATLGKAGETPTRIPLDYVGTQVLSYTRTLSLYTIYCPLVLPQHLDDILDRLIAFKNVRQLEAFLFATHYVRHPLASHAHYFGTFQPTLRSLNLKTCLTNPWDLITFIAFFPLLEDITIQVNNPYSPSEFPENKREGFEPAALSFRGSLRLCEFCQANTFVLELVKSRVQYHTLSFRNVTAWMGIRELIAACAPTLRVLDFFAFSCGFLSLLSSHSAVYCGCLTP